MDTEQTTNSGDRKIDNRPETKRNVVTRYQQTNQMETCTVCAGSFKKGRGLMIHMTKSGCRATEINRKKNKSKKGSPQDKHHSGSAREIIPGSSASPSKTSKKEENVTEEIRSPIVDSTRKPDSGKNILQCLERQGNAQRQRSTLFSRDKTAQQVVEDDRLRRRNRRSVLMECATKEESTKPRRQSNSKKTHIQSMDIRSFGVDVSKSHLLQGFDSDKITVRLGHEVPNSSKPSSPHAIPQKREQRGAEHGTDQKPISMPDAEEWLIEHFGRWTDQDFGEKSCQEENPEIVVKDTDGDTEKQPIEILDEEDSPKRNSRSESDQGTAEKPISISGDEASPIRMDEICTSQGTVEKPITIPDREDSPTTVYSTGDIRQFFVSNEEKESNECFKKLVNNLNSGPPDDILSKHRIQMRRRDYRTLSGVNFLNDKIIDEYLTLIKERNEKEDLPGIYTFPSYVFPHLLGDFSHYDYIEQKIKTDLTTKNIVLIPIHYQDHWSLVSVFIDERRILYYDSIRGSQHRSSGPRIFKKFFETYFERRGKKETFTVKIMDNAPLQGNGYDCGVFVCQNAEKIARTAPVLTRQEDMEEARKRMMKEIYLGHLVKSSNVYLQDLAKKSTPTIKKAEKEQQQTNSKSLKKKRLPDAQPKKTASAPKMTKERINWPKTNSKEWDRLDTDLSMLLKVIYSPPEKKAISHPTIIFQMCKERFGIKENKTKTTQGIPSRRQQKCRKLREEIKILKKTYAEALPEEKDAVKELQNEKLKKLRLAKRAESIKKNRKQFSANCHGFLSQPFQFARNILSPKPKGNLESSKETVESHLKAAHSNPLEDAERARLDELLDFASPETDFDDSFPTYKEFATKLRRTRSKSAPGPNGVPYLVYKRCQGVSRQLWYYIRELWKRNTVSSAWREAEGVFIPKEDGATTVDKFRTISLLNVEGKLFFSLKADRITTFLMSNNFIDPSIQKGGIPGVSGCLEHTAILSQLMREAKKEKKNLVVTWLDIANAYGSIPHDVIRIALERAHVPEKTRDLIASYYSDARIRFTTKNFTTDWQKVEKGIITGCTLSVVLFSLTMSWLVESVKRETKGPRTSTGQRQANSRLFMDDITTTTETVPQTRHLLEKLADKLNWAGLRIKPEKCRSLVIFKGELKSMDIKINGKSVTPIQKMPIKYLGKKYTASLNEKEQTDLVAQQLNGDLKKIERCRLPGRYKCWMVQHMLIPRIMWPLSIYNIAMTKVEDLQKKITAALKRWLKIPKSLSKACIYSRSAKLRLPYSSLEEEFRSSKVRNLVTMGESKDPCIQNAGIAVDGGRKVDTPSEIMEAKSRLQMKEITGIPNKGREGLGMQKRKYYSSSSSKVKRDMIVQSIREKEEEKRVVTMAGFSKQGAHLKWDVPQRRLKHNNIINTSDVQLSFLIKAVYDLLPTPANKSKWFNREETCTLCGGEGTLNHILSCCKVALAQGRYTWRHNKVLKEVAASIQKKITENSTSPKSTRTRIPFVREGDKIDPETPKETVNYLSTATDWKMAVDLEGQLKIPVEVTITNLRPDITITSRNTKQMAIVELTVPAEERIEVSGELKRMKYEHIAQEGKLKGWRVRIWAIEVGCKGFPAASLSTFFKDIGYPGGQRKKVVESIGRAAEQASHTLWKTSFYKDWGRR